MTFLNPILGGVGLACVALPILIHILLRRRRKPIAWGAMKFLLEAYRQQRRRLRLEQILLLASRCLLVALLALALGKPLLGALAGAGAAGPRTVVFLIDNSLTAGLQDEDAQPALERHKRRALGLIAELDATRGDSVGVLTLASPIEARVFPPSLDLAASIAAIKELSPRDSRADVPAALLRARELLQDVKARGADVRLVLLSDWRVGSAEVGSSVPSLLGSGEPGAPRGDAPRLLVSAPADREAANVSIAGVEPISGVLVSPGPDAPPPPVVARVELRRSGSDVREDASTRLRLEIVRGSDPSPLAAAERAVRWKAGEETNSSVASLEMPPGVSLAEASREGLLLRATIDRDALPADNVFERPLEARARVNVAIVAPRTPTPSSIEGFTPAHWWSLALFPSDDGSIRARRAGDLGVTLIEPARELSDAIPPGAQPSPGALAGFDAIVLAAPEALGPSAWKRVQAASLAGALTITIPPPDAGAHSWGEPFAEALAVPWTIAREPREVPEASRAIDPVPQSAARDLLSSVAAELPDLVKPIGVRRILAVDNAGQDRLLSLADASPLVLADFPGAASGASRGGVVLFAASTDLSWTDLPAKPLMVPLVQELVRQGVARSAGARTLQAGAPSPLLSGAVEAELVRPRSADAGAASVELASSRPEPGRADAPPALRTAGVWRLRGAGSGSLGLVAVNPDPAGSRVETRARPEVSAWLESSGASQQWLDDEAPRPSNAPGLLGRTDNRPPFSFPLLVAAGVMALVEAAFGRFFSHARGNPA